MDKESRIDIPTLEGISSGDNPPVANKSFSNAGQIKSAFILKGSGSPRKLTMSGCLELRFLTDIFTFATVYTLAQANDFASGNKIIDEETSIFPAFQLLHIVTMVTCVLSNVPTIYALILANFGLELSPKRYVIVFLLDMVNMVVLLVASACATSAHYASLYGDAMMGWEPICDEAGSVCYYHGLALIFSYLNSAFYMTVVIYSFELMRNQLPDDH